MKEVIIFFSIIGFTIICVIVSDKVINKILDYRISKLEKKYPEAFSVMHEYNEKLDDAVNYWNEKIVSLKNEIDDLVEDNYIQPKEKDEKLFQLREELKSNKELYNILEIKYKELYEKAQSYVDTIYQTDKRIRLVWTPSCKKEK